MVSLCSILYLHHVEANKCKYNPEQPSAFPQWVLPSWWGHLWKQQEQITDKQCQCKLEYSYRILLSLDNLFCTFILFWVERLLMKQIPENAGEKLGHEENTKVQGAATPVLNLPWNVG